MKEYLFKEVYYDLVRKAKVVGFYLNQSPPPPLSMLPTQCDRNFTSGECSQENGAPSFPSSQSGLYSLSGRSRP